jgi:hypothetical protein
MSASHSLRREQGGFTESKNLDSFDFSLRTLVRADGKKLSTKFQRGPAAQ